MASVNGVKIPPTQPDLPNEVLVTSLINLFFAKQYDALTHDLEKWLLKYPHWLDGWKMLSDTYLVQKKDATHAAHQALLLSADDAKSHCYYGLVLKSQHQLVAASRAFEQAIALSPQYVEAINNLGIVNKDMGNYATAIAYFKRALTLNPNYASCYSNLLFCMSHSDQVDANMLLQESQRFGAYFEQLAQPYRQKHSNPKAPAKPLNIGFVSSCFRAHSLANFIGSVLPYLHSMPSLRLIAYANNALEDATTCALKQHFHQWHVVDQLNDLELTNTIRQDKVDILIDLDGHTAGNRLTAFAHKPAPIQISWLGYLATTGFQTMDYYLADAALLPPNQYDAQFTERLVQLPINAPFMPDIHAPAINRLPAKHNGYITYACFNRASKINQSTVQLWSQILKHAPQDKLLLMGHATQADNALIIRWFKENGVCEQQLVFVSRLPMQDYLALHLQVDICLDTMPSNGVTTTCHAATMGVPTLCLAGAQLNSRGAQAIMQHLGLTDFVAESKEDFYQKAMFIKANLLRLENIRATLRAQFDASSLAKPEQAAIGLAEAFKHMWKRWCKGKSPATFQV
jgi:predicted O-linked N-acetylglucosamine transferase (SPINDLY family)